MAVHPDDVPRSPPSGRSERRLAWRGHGEGRRSRAFGTDGVVTRVAEHLPLVNNGVQRIHRVRGKQEALDRARRCNPVGSHGFITQAAEHVPGLNNVVQGLHKHAGNVEALHRAKEKNPLRADGIVVEAAEYIPGVNNFIQGLHKVCGKEEQLCRARQRNPFGTDGYITRVGERIPVVADGIRCVHKLRGRVAAEERARPYSLRGMVSKDGAITKVAELLPGSNLIAAVVLDMRGHHEEAEAALNLIKNWREFGSADGALAKVAELLPGIDFVAFGLHVHHGHFAQALRSIVKTRWIDITATSIHFTVATTSLRWMELVKLEATNVEITPKSNTVAGGIIDLCTNLVEVNRSGERRLRRRRRSNGSELNLRERAQDMLLRKLNELMQGTVDGLVEQAPEFGNMAAACVSSYLARWRAKSWPLRMLLPEVLPQLGAALLEALQDSMGSLTVLHGPLPQATEVRPRHRGELRRHAPAAAAAVSCFSFLGHLGLGLHTGGLGCLAGVAAGTGHLGQRLRRWAVPFLNRRNHEAWERATALPEAEQRAEPRRPRDMGVTVELPAAQAACLWGQLHSFLLREALGGHVAGLLAKAAERLLCSTLRGLEEPPELLFGFEVCELSIDTGAFVWRLPRLPMSLLAQLRADAEGISVSGLRLGLSDTTVREVLDSLLEHIVSLDLRSLDPRLAGFADPVHLIFDLGLQWEACDLARLEVRDLHVKLQLPQ